MKIVRVFTDIYDCVHIKQLIENVFACKDGSFEISTDNENYTHAIVLNTVMPTINVEKENVIGLACEPRCLLQLTDEFKKYAKQNIGRYFIGDATFLTEPFESHYSFMWYLMRTPRPLPLPTSRHIMSIIVSEKTNLPGHKYRHDLVAAILQTNLPIDIYGRAANHFVDNTGLNRIKGGFFDDEPYTNYRYTVAVENSQSQAYVSEKFTSAIVQNCVPLYWGATNVEKWFGSNCCIKLSGSIETDTVLMTKICSSPQKYCLNLSHAQWQLSYGAASFSTMIRDWKPTRASDHFHKTVTAKLCGGWGNQLFMVAATLEYALQNNCMALIPNSFDWNNSPFVYTSQVKFIDDKHHEQLLKTSHKICENTFSFNELPPIIFSANVLIGYFQSCRYFKSIERILQVRETDDKDLLVWNKFLEKNNQPFSHYFVSMHVRRGDYLTEKNKLIFNQLSDEYYESAMKQYPEQSIFIVFSNDTEYCINKWKNNKRVLVFSEKWDDKKDFMLMANECYGGSIIANSSFSWWAAYIAWNQSGKHMKVCMPKTWFGPNGPKKHSLDVFGWTKI